MSIRGDVVDHLRGHFQHGEELPLESPTRRKTANHTVTGSVPVDRIWAATKHALLFSVSYTGLVDR